MAAWFVTGWVGGLELVWLFELLNEPTADRIADRAGEMVLFEWRDEPRRLAS